MYNLFAIVVGPPILSILYSFISFMSKFSPSTNKLAPLSKIFFAINQNGILLDSVLNIGRYESYISRYIVLECLLIQHESLILPHCPISRYSILKPLIQYEFDFQYLEPCSSAKISSLTTKITTPKISSHQNLSDWWPPKCSSQLSPRALSFPVEHLVPVVYGDLLIVGFYTSIGKTF